MSEDRAVEVHRRQTRRTAELALLTAIVARIEDRTVEVYCAEASHPDRRVTIAVFEEDLDTAGNRVNISLPYHHRFRPDGVGVIKPNRPDLKIDPDGTGEVVESTRPWTVLMTKLDERWHYQLRCLLCGRNVSTKYEPLMKVLGTALDNGVSELDMTRLQRILDA